jgi:transcriptional regulator with PAS, ATPase and Fis domain
LNDIGESTECNALGSNYLLSNAKDRALKNRPNSEQLSENTPSTLKLGDAVKTSEFKTIQSAIKSTKNRNDAAKVLGISPRTLRYKLAQFKNLETQQYSFE